MSVSKILKKNPDLVSTDEVRVLQNYFVTINAQQATWRKNYKDRLMAEVKHNLSGVISRLRSLKTYRSIEKENTKLELCILKLEKMSE